jgi:PST family polysaccharide transporter
MKMIAKKINQLFSSKFISNVGWLSGAELVNRIFRLGTTVTLARLFSPQDYGLMAVVYTTFEFASVFTLKYGIGAKIIQADEQDIKTICDTAYWLNWMLCGTIFILQCVAAFPIARFYGNNQLILPICTIALVYLMFPFFMVQASMIQRENRLKITALSNVIQSIISNIVTIILALLGMGVWAVVWPLVLSTPVWIVINWINHPWRPPSSFKLDQWQEITHYGGNLFGIELSKKLRANLDYLIAGRFLGIEALGIYYFAFNAGLGISLNIINLSSSALFPYLCEVRGNINLLEERYFSSLKKICLITIPIILLQSGLAPFYVPIIFGQKWVGAIPILVIICLSALMFPLAITTNELLNALGKTHITLYWNLAYTLIFAFSILIGVRWGTLGIAIAVCVCQLLVLPIFSVWVIKAFLLRVNKFSK